LTLSRDGLDSTGPGSIARPTTVTNRPLGNGKHQRCVMDKNRIGAFK
jgi:hypothetical protein